jgi:hypothetical protein
MLCINDFAHDRFTITGYPNQSRSTPTPPRQQSGQFPALRPQAPNQNINSSFRDMQIKRRRSR